MPNIRVIQPSAFWFHYNKPASQREGRPVMTVHHKGACILVRNIVCSVPVRSRERNSQPRVVMAGRGNVHIAGDTAYIVGGAPCPPLN